MEKFTIEEIRNYILSQDSLGDVLYFLNEANVKAAQIKREGKWLECWCGNPVDESDQRCVDFQTCCQEHIDED